MLCTCCVLLHNHMLCRHPQLPHCRAKNAELTAAITAAAAELAELKAARTAAAASGTAAGSKVSPTALGALLHWNGCSNPYQQLLPGQDSLPCGAAGPPYDTATDSAAAAAAAEVAAGTNTAEAAAAGARVSGVDACAAVQAAVGRDQGPVRHDFFEHKEQQHQHQQVSKDTAPAAAAAVVQDTSSPMPQTEVLQSEGIMATTDLQLPHPQDLRAADGAAAEDSEVSSPSPAGEAAAAAGTSSSSSSSHSQDSGSQQQQQQQQAPHLAATAAAAATAGDGWHVGEAAAIQQLRLAGWRSTDIAGLDETHTAMLRLEVPGAAAEMMFEVAAGRETNSGTAVYSRIAYV
jgi:hypothetical protein